VGRGGPSLPSKEGKLRSKRDTIQREGKRRGERWGRIHLLILDRHAGNKRTQ